MKRKENYNIPSDGAFSKRVATHRSSRFVVPFSSLPQSALRHSGLRRMFDTINSMSRSKQESENADGGFKKRGREGGGEREMGKTRKDTTGRKREDDIHV